RYWSVTGVQTCALPIYARGRELAAAHRELQFNLARPSHFVALLDDETMLAVAERQRLRAKSRECRGGGAGRRVFVDAKAQPEHPGVEIVSGVDRLAAEDVGRAAVGSLERGVPFGVIGAAAAEGVDSAAP